MLNHHSSLASELVYISKGWLSILSTFCFAFCSPFSHYCMHSSKMTGCKRIWTDSVMSLYSQWTSKKNTTFRKSSSAPTSTVATSTSSSSQSNQASTYHTVFLRSMLRLGWAKRPSDFVESAVPTVFHSPIQNGESQVVNIEVDASSPLMWAYQGSLNVKSRHNMAFNKLGTNRWNRRQAGFYQKFWLQLPCSQKPWPIIRDERGCSPKLLKGH